MSRPTSRVRFLTVEEFEARAVPALLGLSLPSVSLPGLTGLIGTIENTVSGLFGSPSPTDPAPAPEVVVTPPLPGLPTTPVGEVPTPEPVTLSVGSGEPVAGPVVFTPTVPMVPTPATASPAADAVATPTGTTNPTASGATSAAVGTASFAPNGAASNVSPAFPPTTPIGVAAVATADAAPSRTTTAAVAFPAEVVVAPEPLVVGPAALTGFPVDPAAVAVTPPEAVPPGVELADAPAAVTPPIGAALPADATPADVVVTPAAEPEAWNLASWGWSLAVAVAAGGAYWVARRCQLARKLADALLPPKLPVRV